MRGPPSNDKLVSCLDPLRSAIRQVSRVGCVLFRGPRLTVRLKALRSGSWAGEAPPIAMGEAVTAEPVPVGLGVIG